MEKFEHKLQINPSNRILLVPLFLMVIPYFILLILLGSLIGAGFISTTSITSQKEEPKFTLNEIEKETSPSANIDPEGTGFAQEWQTYENDNFGYKFNYPVSIKVTPITKDNCNSNECSLLDANQEIVKLQDLVISSYHSNYNMTFDFDKGLDKSLYKEPRRVIIDKEAYFHIISKDRKVEMFVKEYKYISDTLWVKNEHKVSTSIGNYYISFDKGAIPEEEIYQFEAVLETFRFK